MKTFRLLTLPLLAAAVAWRQHDNRRERRPRSGRQRPDAPARPFARPGRATLLRRVRRRRRPCGRRGRDDRFPPHGQDTRGGRICPDRRLRQGRHPRRETPADHGPRGVPGDAGRRYLLRQPRHARDGHGPRVELAAHGGRFARVVVRTLVDLGARRLDSARAPRLRTAQLFGHEQQRLRRRHPDGDALASRRRHQRGPYGEDPQDGLDARAVAFQRRLRHTGTAPRFR